MTIPRCSHCGQSELELQALVHPPTGEAKRLCVPCLRAMCRAKGPVSDQRGRERLVKAAKQDGQEVWRSDHVLYLLPPMAEAKEPSRPQNKSPLSAGER